MEIHMGGYRAPPRHTARGQENALEKVLRERVEAAVRAADPKSDPSILGTSFHHSRRDENVVQIKAMEWR